MNNILITGTVYNLNNEDQILIKEMAETICKQNRNYFVENYQKDKKMSLMEMNLNGFGAELAFCRLCNLEFNYSTNETENHFSQVDAKLKNGICIDIKNTVYSNGKLIVRQGKEQKLLDIYVLMTGTFPNFKFSGWALYNEIINTANIENLGCGNAYTLPQYKLYQELLYE